MKKMKWNNIIGGVILISGIAYFAYAIPLLYSAFNSECGIGAFFNFWGGIPFLALAFFKLRLGIAFLRTNFKNIKIMLTAMAVLDAIAGLLFQAEISEIVFLGYWVIFYIGPFIYLLYSTSNNIK